MKKDYSHLVGCWIDSCIPRTTREYAERLTELAALLGADSDQLAHESEDLSAEDTELWLEDIILELDDKINEVLYASGFLAIQENGDYIILHQSEYFENESDYLI